MPSKKKISLAGTFVLDKSLTKADRFEYWVTLYARNGKKLMQTEMYLRRKGAVNAIKSVLKLASLAAADCVDLTNEDPREFRVLA